MSRENEVLDKLRNIIDPDLDRDIVSLDFIKNLEVGDNGIVSFTIELTTPACPVKDKFRKDAETLVGSLPWVKGVNVNLSSAPRSNPLTSQAPGLQKVANLIAVSSCKGGVGKSTVAINLAAALSRSDAKVGLFDADVYGPSLPTVARPENTDLYSRNELIIPLTYEGIKMMSFGFVPTGPGGGAAIMRGPMVTQVINQLLTGTEWGELDYLVIDMPPGTGDVQLTLTQVIPITASIIVTTPQELSFVDVVKGIQMFHKLKVPTVAVVENMSYFICDQCDKKHYLFGRGAMDRLVHQFGIQNAFELPLVPEISELSDAGKPIVLEKPEHPVSRRVFELSEAVVREVSRIKYGAAAPPKVSFVIGRGIVVQWPSGKEQEIHPADLRRQCRCAHCINEMTGEPRLDPSSVNDEVYPTHIEPMGNYAVTISWSDGHNTSIYPYDMLLESGNGENVQSTD